jgi:hypothetical protein
MPRSTRWAFNKSPKPCSFNCEADGLFQFLKEVQDRANETNPNPNPNWDGQKESYACIMTNIKGNKEKEEDFINKYGTLTLEQVIAS